LPLRAALCFVLCVVLLAAGPCVVSSVMAADESVEQPDRRMSEEGSLRTVIQPIHNVLPEREGRVPVALRLYAQVYFLHRGDEGFAEKLALLQEALAGNRPIRLTFHAYSGRIVAVARADE